MVLSIHSILVNLLVAGVLALIGFGMKFLQTHTNSKVLSTLEGLAASAVPLVERLYPALSGASKMKAAVDFVDSQLTKLHIPLNTSDIEAAIEKAYAEAKASGVLAVYKQPTPSPAPAPVSGK